MNNIIQKYCSQEWQDFVNFHSEILEFKVNQSIFEIGDDTNGLYLIDTGKVKITTLTPMKTTRIIRLAANNDVIGHRGFGGTWKYTISAIALEDTKVIFIPTKIFNQVVKTNPDFGFYMMMFFAEELRDSESLAHQCPVKNLVAQVLFKNLNAFGLEEGSTKLSYTLSRKDIASMAGTTYETVVRSLSELQKDGAIQIEGKTIHISSEEILKEQAFPFA
ncbi:MAG: Crp/Fnr family transcriptional regulator [Crocinitomicaceae bacterium]|nr:Crp/Fnr family transcriptional regulator [Crocinitomicaceae bacterium]